ncbi:MAG: tRNA guanosine(34) transglycosylase Tgt [Rickettsiales bacterium]
MSNSFSFSLHATDGFARAGLLKTAHGEIRTPIFMPVGTQATVKAMTPGMIRDAGAQVILGNTYHLMLRPGAERVEKLGGLRRFMGWDGPILTDSGGFQVMSLSGLAKVTEHGVEFASHIDGSRHMLSPERSMEIQRALGSTITMIFDECLRYPATEEETCRSTELSLRWAKRSKEAFVPRDGYGLFGIVQGGMSPELRKTSSDGLRAIGFDGYAIGGLAVGEGQEKMFSMLDVTAPMLPKDKPRYLMGVGKPLDIVGAVLRGVDMFDCVMPSRSGRNGQAFTRHGAINLRNAKYAEDLSPLDADCDCLSCSAGHSRAYLHHLTKAGEILASMLTTAHNIRFYLRLTERLREAIEKKRARQFAEEFTARYEGSMAAEEHA